MNESIKQEHSEILPCQCEGCRRSREVVRAAERARLKKLIKELFYKNGYDNVDLQAVLDLLK